MFQSSISIEYCILYSFYLIVTLIFSFLAPVVTTAVSPSNIEEPLNVEVPAVPVLRTPIVKPKGISFLST